MTPFLPVEEYDGWLEVLSASTQPDVLAIIQPGFSSGLPCILWISTLDAWLPVFFILTGESGSSASLLVITIISKKHLAFGT